MASMTLRNSKQQSPSKPEDENIKMECEGDEDKPKWATADQQDDAMSEDEKEEEKDIEQKSPTGLSELTELLNFIEVYEDAAQYFDLNGSRSIYAKLRSDSSRERILHTIVHFFISMHLPSKPEGNIS